MPPKKKGRKPKSKPTQKQKQMQRQSVVVNVGTKPRKSSGRGGLPPPSHMHNLAPTFVTNQQIDYTPLISSILHATGRVGEQNSISQRIIENPITPLSSTTQSSAQQMPGIKAEERRAGPTARNLQPHPSMADERLAMSMEDRPRPPDPIITERLVKADKGASGGGIPEAVGFVKRGRPFATATEGIPVNQTYLIGQRAEEAPLEAVAEKKKKKGKKKTLTVVEPPG